jgi:hypothetical protein
MDHGLLDWNISRVLFIFGEILCMDTNKCLIFWFISRIRKIRYANSRDYGMYQIPR